MDKKHVGSIYFKIHLGLKVQGKNGLGQRVYCRAKTKTFGMVLEAPRAQKTACFTHSLGITGYFFFISPMALGVGLLAIFQHCPLM